ncbi:MAG: Uma2 family endonuclease [Gemmatimonadetes bacterium]|nr:Uma2 family endonuclease [Gemmatimonadota bacterium]
MTMTTQPQNRAFTVGEYYSMAEADILTEEDRVELIAGQIVAMSPIGSRHAACVKRLNLLMGKMVQDSLLIGVQDPIQLDAYSAPEPDLVLLRPRADFYAAAHPSAADVLLAIEVADTSADYDREVKLPLYAQAGIPEVWLIDLQAGHIEMYARPQGDAYQQRVEVTADATLTSPTIPQLALAAADLLG